MKAEKLVENLFNRNEKEPFRLSKNWDFQYFENERKLVTCLFAFFACLPTKHIGVHMNSFKRVRAFQIELEFEVLVF